MYAANKISVLIVDDEQAARQRLEDLLEIEEELLVIGQASSGGEAVQAINRLKPDLVFLDVQMPGLSGIEVVKEVGSTDMPIVIFVTAYDQYALKAFDLAAIDYLLKPFDEDRFKQTLERAKKAVTSRDMSELQSRLAALLNWTNQKETNTPSPPKYLERIGVELRGQMRIVHVDQIEYIKANGDYVDLHVGEETLLIREKMQTLEKRLDPAHFFRTHRSSIVHLDRIDSLIQSQGGHYSVRLKGGALLRVSRGRYQELQQQLGLDTAG